MNDNGPSAFRWSTRCEWGRELLRRRHERRQAEVAAATRLGRDDLAVHYMRRHFAPELLTFAGNGLPSSIGIMRAVRCERDRQRAFSELCSLAAADRANRAVLYVEAFTKRLTGTEHDYAEQIERANEVGLDTDAEADRVLVAVVYDDGDLSGSFEQPYTLDDHGALVLGESRPLPEIETGWLGSILRAQASNPIDGLVAVRVVEGLRLLGHDVTQFDPHCSCTGCEIDRLAEEASAA
jgi:hypothetical protein